MSSEHIMLSDKQVAHWFEHRQWDKLHAYFNHPENHGVLSLRTLLLTSIQHQATDLHLPLLKDCALFWVGHSSLTPIFTKAIHADIASPTSSTQHTDALLEGLVRYKKDPHVQNMFMFHILMSACKDQRMYSYVCHHPLVLKHGLIRIIPSLFNELAHEDTSSPPAQPWIKNLVEHVAKTMPPKEMLSMLSVMASLPLECDFLFGSNIPTTTDQEKKLFEAHWMKVCTSKDKTWYDEYMDQWEGLSVLEKRAIELSFPQWSVGMERQRLLRYAIPNPSARPTRKI